MRLELSVFVCLLASHANAGGFIGYGIPMYRPPCAHGCKSAVTAPLNCTVHDAHGDEHMVVKRMGGMGAGSNQDLPSGDGWMVIPPTPECKATNDYYLQTVAYCISSQCTSVPLGELESFWAREVLAAKPERQPELKTYSRTLSDVVEPPTQILNNSLFLNYTGKVLPDAWLANYNTLSNFAATETTHSRYGLVVFLTGALIPIGLSFLRFLPWPTEWVSKFNAYVIDSPLFGSQHTAPIRGLAMMPTRGQGLFIGYIWAINVILSSVGYEVVWPHLWFATKPLLVESYISNRVGILSFANLPLLVLYAGRNNILLWLTNWSHSTFLLLHRWIAFICMLQAVLHSVMYLHIYASFPGYDHATESQLPYWYWGIVGTLAVAIIVPLSIQPIRQRSYEFFLSSHILLSILALVGCYLHIYYRYSRRWGYENWLHFAVAFWVFDRLVRLARWARKGIKRAYITDIDDDYFRLDIPGVTAPGHVYLHFPSLSTWRFWENHPFSVAGFVRDPDEVSHTPDVGTESKGPSKIYESAVAGSLQTSEVEVESHTGTIGHGLGITIFVRRHEGITSQLCTKRQGIPVLVEGSYDKATTFLQDGHVSPSHSYPNLICIAGGVGITGVLPALSHFKDLSTKAVGSRKLYWGVRTMPLVHAVEKTLGFASASASETERRWADIEVTLSVCQRLDLKRIIESELSVHSGGTTVVVCGPPGMADDVRCIVSGFSRHGGPERYVPVKLIVESFSW